MATMVKHIDKKYKWDKIASQVKKIKGKKVAIGIFTGDVRSDGTNMAVVALTHEMGSRKKNIPARSFYRALFDGRIEEINNFISKRIKAILDLKETEMLAINKIGTWYTGQLKKTIRRLTTPALSAKTIARKHSSKLLIDTGQMINTIRFKIIKKVLFK